MSWRSLRKLSSWHLSKSSVSAAGPLAHKPLLDSSPLRYDREANRFAFPQSLYIAILIILVRMSLADPLSMSDSNNLDIALLTGSIISFRTHTRNGHSCQTLPSAEWHKDTCNLCDNSKATSNAVHVTQIDKLFWHCSLHDPRYWPIVTLWQSSLHSEHICASLENFKPFGLILCAPHIWMCLFPRCNDCWANLAVQSPCHRCGTV